MKKFSTTDRSTHINYALFHHDIDYNDKRVRFDTEKLYDLSLHSGKYELEEIVDALNSIILNQITGLKDSEISITLTGGMDSRVILACLLRAGIKPNCITYGSAESRDVIFAANLARIYGLRFHNTVSTTPEKDWYYNWVVETIIRDDGNSGLHRAHRTAAIAEHKQLYSPKVLFTGHMGGEGLRGLTYNNYFASSFFESVNEKKLSPDLAARKVLSEYFLKYSGEDIRKLIEIISNLSWMKNDTETNKFFFLYDLVGKIHHSQDIRLYETFIPNVIPVFLQEKYLEVLFDSKYHFRRKSGGITGRLRNPFVHCKLLELIFPELLEFPLSNGYAPREYLKGPWYYLPVRTIRNFRNRKMYSPSFSYGKWFYEFIHEHSQNVDKEIWEFFDKTKYMKALRENEHGKDEGYWLKFSIPIYFDFVIKNKKGLLLH